MWNGVRLPGEAMNRYSMAPVAHVPTPRSRMRVSTSACSSWNKGANDGSASGARTMM